MVILAAQVILAVKDIPVQQGLGITGQPVILAAWEQWVLEATMDTWDQPVLDIMDPGVTLDQAGWVTLDQQVGWVIQDQQVLSPVDRDIQGAGEMLLWDIMVPLAIPDQRWLDTLGQRVILDQVDPDTTDPLDTPEVQVMLVAQDIPDHLVKVILDILDQRDMQVHRVMQVVRVTPDHLVKVILDILDQRDMQVHWVMLVAQDIPDHLVKVILDILDQRDMQVHVVILVARVMWAVRVILAQQVPVTLDPPVIQDQVDWATLDQQAWAQILPHP